MLKIGTIALFLILQYNVLQYSSRIMYPHKLRLWPIVNPCFLGV